jgi:antitoxin VapB
VAINIKHPETDRLARELARRRGLSITETITEALRSELEREKKRRRMPGLADRLLAIGRRCAALPTRDGRSDDEILGYDERGLPG